ncbi:MAG: hypothetical protein ACPLRW_06800 [Moorellales bacterium]
MEIVRGRTRGYLTVPNDLVDGLLALGPGGIDAVGFYCALKRFVDRRQDGQSETLMDWSVRSFCAKFHIGQERFYRLSELLWRVGLVDIEKEVTDRGWRNRYVIHDCPDYPGPLRQIREGSFRHRSEKVPTGKSEEDISESESDGVLPEGIPETGIPAMGIPMAGIPARGIPAVGTQEKTTTRKEQVSEKDKSTESATSSCPATDVNVAIPKDSTGKEIGLFSFSSNEEKEKRRASRAQGFQFCPEGSVDIPSQPIEETEECQESDVTAFETSCLKRPQGESDSPDVTNQTLIAELVERLHRIPGVEKLRGHYPLVGRAYNQYGYQCVRAALDDVEAEYRGAELLGQPYPDERELARLLFGKCRWNQKRLAGVLEKANGNGTGNRNGNGNGARRLSFTELERLGCIIERAPDGRPLAVRVPSDEVRRRVRAARQQT